MPRPRLPKSARKTNNIIVHLNEQERDALDAEVERLGVGISDYLRTLILAAHSGELPVAPLFSER